MIILDRVGRRGGGEGQVSRVRQLEVVSLVDAQASSPFTALICRTAVLISTLPVGRVRDVGLLDGCLLL